MPTQQIICVKIAQRVIGYPTGKPKSPYTYFPYDRVYLAPKNMAPIFKKLFRYHLIMDLDRDLYTALIALDAKHLSHITISRNDNKKTGTKLSGPGKLEELLPGFLDHVMVVPTHVQTVYKDVKNKKGAFASGLRYIMSHAVVSGHNEKVKMPPIKLVTPKKEIALLCGACTKLPNFYTGECSPGQSTCVGKANIRVTLDQQHRESTKRAIKETGGDS